MKDHHIPYKTIGLAIMVLAASNLVTLAALMEQKMPTLNSDASSRSRYEEVMATDNDVINLNPNDFSFDETMPVEEVTPTPEISPVTSNLDSDVSTIQSTDFSIGN